MNVPVTIYANEKILAKMLTDRTINQAVNVTHLPGLCKHVVVLPDGHEGYGFPIGGVAATDLESGVISPGGVGYDINCGVRLIRTNLTEKEVKPKINILMKELFKAAPSGLGSKSSIRLTPGQLNNVLEDGVKWAINNGYGWDSDAEYCEENGTMILAKGGHEQKYEVEKKCNSGHLTQMQINEDLFPEEVWTHCNLCLGDSVLFSAHCPHKTGFNSTQKARVSLVARYGEVNSITNSGWDLRKD